MIPQQHSLTIQVLPGETVRNTRRHSRRVRVRGADIYTNFFQQLAGLFLGLLLELLVVVPFLGLLLLSGGAGKRLPQNKPKGSRCRFV